MESLNEPDSCTAVGAELLICHIVIVIKDELNILLTTPVFLCLVPILTLWTQSSLGNTLIWESGADRTQVRNKHDRCVSRGGHVKPWMYGLICSWEAGETEVERTSLQTGW